MDAKYGVYRAAVTQADDPEGAGRVQVRLPATKTGVWARLASVTRPRAGDEVLVVFEAGDARQPYVLGFLWSGDSPPPAGAGARPARDS